MSAENIPDKNTAQSKLTPAEKVRDTALLSMEIRKLLHFYHQVGIKAYPKTEAFKLPAFKRKKSKQEVFAKPSLSRPLVQKNSPQEKNVVKRADLLEMYEAIERCDTCSLHASKQPGIPEELAASVKLMIVGDFCLSQEEENTPVVFGQQEDEMVAKMIGALGLCQQDVYVTNCIKCRCAKENTLTFDNSDCHDFLAREILAVQPLVICAMGDLSAKVLLGKNAPLVRLRGKFHHYVHYEQYPVEVMPTFHPRFLLAHGEMKRATWGDLLQIQKKYLHPGRR
ncbi:MAG: hypothetical protein CSB34_04870 [Desulfobulbus propionicus]|nr:MAG: hypothetical protein CSB34_04870 [Desulfobulbus propionicus]PIE66479.1 MAG: hypothetical protein CSA26_00755 [Desulfobacterales bacterium]